MKKICFFLQTPLTRRDYERFGVELLRNIGFEVLFLDMTAVMNPDYKSSEKIATDSTVYCNTYDDADKFLRDSGDMFGIDMIGARVINVFFYRILKRHKVRYAAFCANSIPTSYSWNSKGMDLIGNIKILFGSIVWRLPNSLLGLPTPDYVLAGGERYSPKRPQPGSATRVIWAHSLDYDKYLEYCLSDRIPLIDGGYAVFLDEYFPLHPDYNIKGGMHKNPFSEDRQGEYYTGMNRFFSYLENRIGIPIAIAAHPKSKYEDMPGVFGERKMFKGKTIELVSRARYVIAHVSTSVNFAVLFRKPIVFVTMNAMESTPYGPLISNFASQFNERVVNIDLDPAGWPAKEPVIVAEGPYKEYVRRFIKTDGSPQLPFWQIVGDRLKAYN
ncbi:MAG: hypothetical protein WC592_01365 [Candidatus Omnitrophota bacterium]